MSAILAADVAGYSRLMHHAEEATHAKLSALLAEVVRPAIAEHGGRIVKNTGDGFLAEFPSAVEAVRAAAQFQTRIKELTVGEAEDTRITFRVGINIGDVIVEPHDIFGDGVNIAARLEGIAEPEGICVSSSAYDHIRGKVGIQFVDLGDQNLKNIDRPVRAYAALPNGPSPATQAERARSSSCSPPRLSIVVLPFVNLSGDPNKDYFADGVTESLTTDLSRIRGSFVIGRHTAFTFKGKAVDLKQIGRELNVRYVLEGSVQRSGNRLRVNVQLIDAETGNHLWAERFDKLITDLFDMQDEIVARLANTLDAQLIAAEARRAERSLHPNSMDLFFQGKACWNKGFAPEYMTQARDFFERSLALDSNNIDAMVFLAAVHIVVGANKRHGHLSHFSRRGNLTAMARAATLEEIRSGPVRPSDRINSIDALRGIALFGVLAINVVTIFRVSIFERFLFHQPTGSPIDSAVQTILMLAVDLKALALFSLLFGAGLAIQFERLANSGRRTALLVRRLAVLLAFGLIHLCLIWNGDILTEYALAGLIVLPFLFGPRWLLAVAALASLGLYLAMQAFPPPGLFPSTAAMALDIMEAHRIYPTGGFLDVLAFRLREIPLFAPLHAYIFPRTIGLFLLGAFAWRTGILRNPSHHLLFSIAAACIGLGAALILSEAGGFIRVGRIGALAEPLGIILLALGYGAAIIGIANLDSGKRLLGWAAPLGRMAFTSYLAQSVIFGWIFYGYGLGLFGRLGPAAALAIGIVVYVAQVLFSKWWLLRYRYGPVEWLWRTLMYGVRQPLLLSQLSHSL